MDEALLEWASERQAELLQAVNEHGGYRAAARALGVADTTVKRCMDALKARAALMGYSPEHHLTRPVAPGLALRGTSQLFRRGEAAPVLEWVKTRADSEQIQQFLQATVDAMSEQLPRVAPLAPPRWTNANLCNLYTMTDCHMGMLAWHKEGGADWDIKIAERTLTGCFEHMVAASPAARLGVVAQLGDFLHSDGLMPVTPTSGHILDQDGRFAKVVQASIRVLRRLVDFALTKHERVIVLMAEGNHDMASSVWLRSMFQALYENEPRVMVIDSELPYYAIQHGHTMLAFHHGHLKKNDQLPLTFAAQFPAMWGATTKRYAHTGHRHHVEEKEHSGMTVVQHPTVAARDAYAARGGWIAERQVTAMTYHDRFGLVARNTVTPEMLGEHANPAPASPDPAPSRARRAGK